MYCSRVAYVAPRSDARIENRISQILSQVAAATLNDLRDWCGREGRDYAFVIVGADAGMLRMTRVPFPGWLTISTLPP
jgi:hypothetical protein